MPTALLHSFVISGGEGFEGYAPGLGVSDPDSFLSTETVRVIKDS